MIDQEILSFLGEAYCPAKTAYYSKIAEWESWWRGHNRSFHEYFENAAGGGTVRRELYRMNMAKKICEDWASLILNDKVRILLSDEVGNEFVHKVFSDTGFMALANKLVEKVFATGTGAAILRLSGQMDEGENILFSKDGNLSFEFIDASHIIPLSVRNGEIIDAAFISEGIERGVECIYLESHCLEEDGYVIRNQFLRRENGKLVKYKKSSCPEVIRTGSFTPLFSILTPNIQNNIDESCGLGVSVFADAIDCLKGVDLAFNNFCRDIKLGGKKVFINQSLINRDDNGNIFTPDDVAQQLFVTLGDGDFSDNPMITEHNPELRCSENAQAVQCQLNYLSFRCGLGTHHYTFGDTSDRAKLTATQYMGERQDMRQNTVKHQKNAGRFLMGVVRALLWAAEEVYSLPVDRGCEVLIKFDDSYFNDTETCRKRDLSELEAGVLSPEEYRRKWIEGGENA